MRCSVVRWILQYGAPRLGEENSEVCRPLTDGRDTTQNTLFGRWRLERQSRPFWACSVQGLHRTLYGTHERYPPSMNRSRCMLRSGFIHGLSVCHKSPLCDFPLTFLNIPPIAKPSPSPFLALCLLLTTELVSGTGITAIDVGMVDEIPVAIPGNGDSFESLAYLSTLCSLLGDVVSPSNGLNK